METEYQEIEEFLASLAERNRSPNTIKYYRYVINNCLEILKENGHPTAAKDIGTKEISFLIQELDVKESTKKAYLMILGKMIEFHTDRNPVEEMGLLWNRPERERKFITMDEFRTLLENADPTERLVLILGGFTGMRRKEIAELRYEDVKTDHIIIHGKGHGTKGNVRNQPISPYVKFEIDQYYKWKNAQPEKDLTNGRLLCFKMDGCLYSYDGRLSNMTNLVTRLAARCEVDASCHSLRRLFATTLITEGCPLETVRELMRHTSINTTIDCYVDPMKLRKEEWVEKCSSVLSTTIATSKGKKPKK